MRLVLSHVYSWPEVRRGGERYLHELAAAMKDAGHDVTILSTAKRAGTAFHLGVEVRYLRRRELLPRRMGDLNDEGTFGLQALAHLGLRPPEVWHALGTADAAMAGALAKVRDVVPAYTNLGLPERSFRDGRPDRRLHDFVVANVDAYICLSKVGTRLLRDGYGRPGHTVSGGVDTRRFVPSGSRAERPTLLFASALNEPRKNLALLLDAFALLLERVPHAQLWLSGPGDPTGLMESAPAEVRRATEHLGLMGPEDLSSLYGRAWATVLPSHHETFGLVLVESLACGTPIVALDDGYGAAEIVEPGIGHLAKESAQGLSDACERVLDDSTSTTVVEQCREASMAYDWRKSIVPQIEAAYAGVAASPPRSPVAA